MSLDVKEVKKIAKLARLSVADKSEQDLTTIATDLNKIFDWVDQMQAVNTDDITPMAHPLDTTQRTRVDEVLTGDEHTENQKIAPLTEAGLYLVPTVIE